MVRVDTRGYIPEEARADAFGRNVTVIRPVRSHARQGRRVRAYRRYFLMRWGNPAHPGVFRQEMFDSEEARLNKARTLKSAGADPILFKELEADF